MALESEIQLRESGLPLTIGIPSSSSTDKESRSCNPESTVWNPESMSVLDPLTCLAGGVGGRNLAKSIVIS